MTTEEFVLIDYNKKQLLISSDQECKCVWFQWTAPDDEVSFKFSPQDAYRIGSLLIEKSRYFEIGNLE